MNKVYVFQPDQFSISTADLFDRGEECRYKFRIIEGTIDTLGTSPFVAEDGNPVDEPLSAGPRYYQFLKSGNNTLSTNLNLATVEIVSTPRDSLGRYLIYGVVGFLALKFLGYFV